MLHAKQIPVLFQYTAGSLLLAVASMVCVINLSGPIDWVTPHEPVLGLSIWSFFWIIGVLSLGVSLVCLFARHAFLPATLTTWLAFNGAVYLAGLYSMGAHGLTGYLGGFTYTFGCPAVVGNVLVHLLLASLLFGGVVASYQGWCQRRQEAGQIRISCPACGGHIRFMPADLGKQTPCPHCQKTLKLRKPDLLKMACFFCKEHIEFPSHAIGEKMPCPHCKMDITLKEPA